MNNASTIESTQAEETNENSLVEEPLTIEIPTEIQAGRFNTDGCNSCPAQAL